VLLGVVEEHHQQFRRTEGFARLLGGPGCTGGDLQFQPSFRFERFGGTERTGQELLVPKWSVSEILSGLAGPSAWFILVCEMR
jgi:hypothetical protein